MGVRLGTVVVACLAVGSACSSGQRTTGEQQAAPTSSEAAPSTTEAPTTTERASTTTRAATTTTAAAATTTTTAATTTTTSTLAPTTTSTLPPTTTTTVLPVYDPACVVFVAPGDTLTAIVERRGDAALTVEAVQMENAIADPTTLSADSYLDVCVGNDLDDITGQPRVPPTTAPPPVALAGGVPAQQQKLNELFYGRGLPGLTVDGDSGRLTEQQLCAARLALNLPVSRADMEPGGGEEQALMAATSLSIPAGAPTWAWRWVLIDRTCQVMFVGEGSNRIVFVFQTSTGEPGYETRDQNGSAVFRYRSASGNGGWHNSYDYPVGEDNPLNGNMYRPLYFDNGQAIHGANNVPTSPASKGCARLRVASHDLLIDWLGLSGTTGSIGDPDQIGLVVSVQGDFY